MKALIVTFAILTFSVKVVAQDMDDRRIMEMMNQIRKEQGVKPLKFHPKLDSIADVWVKEIFDSLGTVASEEIIKRQEKNPKYLHINLKNRALKSKLTKGLLCISISENVAFSYGNVPKDLTYFSFNAWKNSEPHYKGMIRESSNYFGHSRIISENGRVLYITVFANVIE